MAWGKGGSKGDEAAMWGGVRGGKDVGAVGALIVELALLVSLVGVQLWEWTNAAATGW